MALHDTADRLIDFRYATGNHEGDRLHRSIAADRYCDHGVSMGPLRELPDRCDRRAKLNLPGPLFGEPDQLDIWIRASPESYATCGAQRVRQVRFGARRIMVGLAPGCFLVELASGCSQSCFAARLLLRFFCLHTRSFSPLCLYACSFCMRNFLPLCFYPCCGFPPFGFRLRCCGACRFLSLRFSLSCGQSCGFVTFGLNAGGFLTGRLLAAYFSLRCGQSCCLATLSFQSFGFPALGLQPCGLNPRGFPSSLLLSLRFDFCCRQPRGFLVLRLQTGGLDTRSFPSRVLLPLCFGSCRRQPCGFPAFSFQTGSLLPCFLLPLRFGLCCSQSRGLLTLSLQMGGLDTRSLPSRILLSLCFGSCFRYSRGFTALSFQASGFDAGSLLPLCCRQLCRFPMLGFRPLGFNTQGFLPKRFRLLRCGQLGFQLLRQSLRFALPDVGLLLCFGTRVLVDGLFGIRKGRHDRGVRR